MALIRNRAVPAMRHMCMAPRSLITVGWVFIAAAGGLAIAAIFQALDAVNRACIQPLVTNGLVHSACPGTGAEFIQGLICAALAGAAFFSGLTCFFWAAHLRSMQQMAQVLQSRE